MSVSRRDLILNAPATALAAPLARQGAMVEPSGPSAAPPTAPGRRPRARDIGLAPGVFRPGPLNAITDVAGVRVAHVTLNEGESVRTGVTAIAAHGGNLFQDKVPAAIQVGNGFGKLAGFTQVCELGEIESPIILTNTLNVAEGIAGAVEWSLAQPGNGDVRSVNAVVGETNDGYLNDIRGRHLTKRHVIETISAMSGGPVTEGCVGAGTGTQCFSWKGGIGTSSRVLPKKLGAYTVGALVQTNYGGVLSIGGAPVGLELHKHDYIGMIDDHPGDGSVMIVLATDAPLSDRNLNRLARRAFLGIARTGSAMSNGSGDYAIAFSTAAEVRRTPARRQAVATVADLPNDAVSPLFQAVTEAVEEAVYNALLQAVTTVGVDGHRLEALPAETVKAILDRHGLAGKPGS